MLFKKATKIASIAAILGLALAGCGAQGDPTSAPAQEQGGVEQVRLGTVEEAATLMGKEASRVATSGVNGILIKGDCAMVLELAMARDDLGTHNAAGKPPKRAAVVFETQRVNNPDCRAYTKFLQGAKIIDSSGAKISEYRSVFAHKPHIDGPNAENSMMYRGEPTQGVTSNMAVAMEVPVEKFGPEMRLVLETTDGELVVEDHDWTKLLERPEGLPSFKDGACLSVAGDA